MTNHKNESIEIACETSFYLSLREITYSFGVPPETIIEIIDEGIIIVQKDDYDEWQFDNEAYRRIRTVLQLTKDLGVNLAGAALALELLNEIDRLQTLLTQQ